MKNTIVLATRNKGKAKEFAYLLEPFGITVTNLTDYPELQEIEETGSTFEENAFLKASTVCNALGIIAIADDSGLEVDFLDKAPGVYSARYSTTAEEPATDKKNIEKVLCELQGVPLENRTGRFCCCIAVVAPNGEKVVSHGTWEGLITEKEEGKNGFGYDPIFFDPELSLTASQMSAEQKNSCSHRATATKKLLAQWPSFWAKASTNEA